jgi:DNA polymerase III subunit alpha
LATDFFHVHAHSEFSCLDGTGTVEGMVEKAAALDQPALALTDHGNMAGAIRLYKQCQKHGITAFPGSEMYLVRSVSDPAQKENRFHLGLLALDATGFKTLVRLSSLSHKRERFHRKPLIDLSDLASLSEEGLSKHFALTTGCYFGLVQQTLVKEGPRKARRIVEMYARWFPNTVVEVQNHWVDHHDGYTDLDICDELISIARTLGLPVVATQDSHYLEKSEQMAHDLMKDICYFGDGEDNHFPGDSYHLCDVEWVKSHYDMKRHWRYCEEGYAYLLDLNKLRLPALDKYKFRVPKVHENGQRRIDHLCRRKLFNEAKQAVEWGKHADRAAYTDRLNYELEVISKMGMANYFLLVKEVTDWCRQHEVVVNARGSANGSLVCYLLGITNVDPLQWGTSFDRFISLDRQKPPDIDLDVESTSRDLVIEHLRAKFPTMVNIGTYSRIGFSNQKEEDGTGEDSGSVVVQYMAAMRRKHKDFNGTIDPFHRAPLNDLCDMAVRKAPGAHAAGYVLPGDKMPIDAYLATQLIPSSGTTVTQAVMEDVDEAGYVKLDVLGLRSLRTVSMTLEQVGIKLDDIPWDDKDACKLLRSGKGAGIFQFDGWSTAKGGRQMGVKSTKDAIICLALYRPAMMAGGQTERYLANRKAPRAAERLPALFDDILKDTCWVPVFQEQIMAICRTLGMAYEDWNELLKAVKASNDKIGQYAVDVMSRIMPIFQQLCEDKGMTDEEAKITWDSVVGFTDYGFNRAHATSYGIMAYRSAYLKAHHPLEYMQALLDTWAGTDKERQYLVEARRLGITIARPDVTASDVSWTVDERPMTLRKGLLSIRGIGLAAAETIVAIRTSKWGTSGGAWEDMTEFIEDMPPRPVSGGKDYAKNGSLCGVMRTLRDAGALTSLGVEP